MTITFFIWDKSGEAGERAGRLSRKLEAKKFNLDQRSTLRASEACVLLCHERDVGSAARATLVELASKGRFVLLYSDGVATERDEDGLHYRQLSSIEKALDWIQPEWDLDRIAAVLDTEWIAIRQRVFCALAILAQCAGTNYASSTAAKNRQEVWRVDREKWKNVLTGVPLSAMLECARMEGKPEVERLVNWILGSKEVPEFLRAAEEASALA